MPVKSAPVVAGAALALTLLCAARPCRADAVAEAMRHYQQGVQLFHDGAYDAALVELDKAYKLAPTYKLLYNIAQVQKQLNDFAHAYDSYERYLNEGGAEVAATRRDEVRAEMLHLASRIGRLQIVTNARTPDILVDDVLVSHGALAGPVNVNAGRRRVSVTDSGGQTQTRVVDVAGGESTRVDITFNPAPQDHPVALAATPEPMRVEPTGPINYTPVWIAGGITVAAAAAGTVTGILALAAKTDYDNDLKVGPNNGSAINSDHSKTVAFRTATDALLGTAVAGAVVTVVLLATRHPTEKTSALTNALEGRF
jgi:hypothetical protein